MTNYREILRLQNLGISNRDIAKSVPCSRNTVASVSERAREAGLPIWNRALLLDDYFALRLRGAFLLEGNFQNHFKKSSERYV